AQHITAAALHIGSLCHVSFFGSCCLGNPLHVQQAVHRHHTDSQFATIQLYHKRFENPLWRHSQFVCSFQTVGGNSRIMVVFVNLVLDTGLFGDINSWSHNTSTRRQDFLTHFTQSFHSDADHITRLQVLRRRHAVTHTFRCAGINDVARHQSHKLAQITDNMCHTKHH